MNEGEDDVWVSQYELTHIQADVEQTKHHGEEQSRRKVVPAFWNVSLGEDLPGIPVQHVDDHKE
jgi:hypothetical protein